MEQGWDPDVKKYFRKVLHSFMFGLLWLSACATTGIYFGLAYGHPLQQLLLFYGGMLLSLLLLLWYYYRTWKK